jgi:hypothetical protein
MEETILSGLDGSLARADSGSVRRSHSHLSRRAKPSILRSVMPRPPYSFGAHTSGHAILHFPPDVLSVPLQRNVRQQMETCTGIAERVVLVRVVRPAFVSRPAFQVGILAATELTKRCSSERLNLLIDKGAPNYVSGNDDA